VKKQRHTLHLTPRAHSQQACSHSHSVSSLALATPSVTLLFSLRYTKATNLHSAYQYRYRMYNINTVLLTACLLSASAAFTTKMLIRHVNGSPSLVSRRASEADGEIDVDSLGDWRVFRRNLAGLTTQESPGCTENERVLRKQNEALANEYHSGVWAHETSTVSCARYCTVRQRVCC
jgi:hypothetical protein